MGQVWLDSTVIGSFAPDIVGTSGDVYLDATDMGDFTLALNGYVYLDNLIIGTYQALTLSEDARYLTKWWLSQHLSLSALTKDDSSPATFIVFFANPPYSLKREFIDLGIDVLFCVGTPDSEALPVGRGYIENVPITIWCINKTGITGTILRWKAERELRRICEAYPSGSLRTLDRLSDNEENLGSTILYSVTYVMRYMRFA